MGVNYIITLCFAVLFLAPDPVFCQMLGVTDGDTIEVLRDHRAIKVRLEGIDCSERSQDFGQKAKQFTVRTGIWQNCRNPPHGRGQVRQDRCPGDR